MLRWKSSHSLAEAGRPREGGRAAAGFCMAPLLRGAVQRPHLCSTAALQLTALAFQRLLLLHPSFACPACSRHRDTGGLQRCATCPAVAWGCMDSAGRAAPLITLTLKSLIILPRVVARHGCPGQGDVCLQQIRGEGKQNAEATQVLRLLRAWLA